MRTAYSADTPVRDPTSHNLWPFEILQATVVGLVLIGVMMLGRCVGAR